MAIQALLVILAVLLVLLFLGVPISYAIAVSSLTAILSSIELKVAVLTAAQRTFVGMSKFSLTAIPFFILAGNIMNQGGIAKRLVDFVMAILGKMPGALLVTNIGTNALFGAISGSASAAAAAVGSMIRDGADEQGYDPAVTAATNAASSCSGLLIPPSNALITYSLASGGTSVAALFMAGYIPGIIWALCCCVVGVLLAIKLGYKGTPGKFDWKNLGVCTLRALPSLSLIIVVIGGIIGGVFSATEGSAIAVVYALVLAFCYRSINLKSLWKIIVDSAKMSGMVVFLVGVSNILGWVMAFLQIPDAVAAALLSLTSNKYIILLIMNVILLVSGTFMDVTPAILIFTPLFLPICQSFGMSTIQFGLILVYNLCIGNIPPQRTVRGHQGGPHLAFQGHAVHAYVLCGHHRRPAAGHLYPGSVYRTAAGNGPDVTETFHSSPKKGGTCFAAGTAFSCLLHKGSLVRYTICKGRETPCADGLF